MDITQQYLWTKKGKTYKTKYFSVLGQLLGDNNHDKECQGKVYSERGSGTDQARNMAHKARD